MLLDEKPYSNLDHLSIDQYLENRSFIFGDTFCIIK